MKQRNTKHEKRLKKLILTCLLLAVVLTVGTYAWFIGMQTVSVDAFEVKIAAVEDLALSLDGTSNSWSTELTITEEILKENTYAKTTYSWTGLKPVSTVGAISADTSKLIMYDKGSLTATAGGYRLMSALVTNKLTAKDAEGNTISGEEDGYVAFDLFIKNMSGDAYYSDLADNEEAIYLSTDSSVTVKEAGTDVSGIQNSVRVAFAQIGRVKSDAAASTIQGISCTSKYDETGVTPICTDRYATIYEPNDKAHVANAITWFNKTCKKRGTNGAYTETSCDPIVDGTHYPTYAVSGVVGHEAAIDVYDGLNGYEGSTSSTAAPNKLVAIDTFTDSEKNETGTDRSEFFTLAPNSITKVRVYVYLEGQDVDNYDFASLGSNILVNFGFTKERFTGTEIGGEDLQTDVNNYNNENKITPVTE